VTKKVLGLALALGLTLGLGACDRGVDGRAIERQAEGEWLSYGRTYDEQRFSPLDEVNRETVGKLGLAWHAEFDTDRGQEATPIVHDGVLYTTTAWSKVYAFDAKTGKLLWAYDPKVPGEKGFDACCDVVNRGVAIWKDKVYVGALDGRLIALDKKTGKPAWSIQTTDAKKPYTITGAPRVVKGKVLIGNAGAEYPVRGYMSAYDADDGKMLWRFHFTPNPTGQADGAASDKAFKDFAAKTWGEGAWKLGGGGATPWDAITYDPKVDLIFVGTGNAGPWNDDIRSDTGDNLFATSIVALKPDTGEYVWHYQTTPRDAWDYDAVQHLMAADIAVGNETRRVVMQANKNGFFYVLDARTGKLLSAEKFIPANWAERVDLATGRPVEAPFARYGGEKVSTQIPGALGGHNWQPMAYSPKERLVYIPASTGRGGFGDPEKFEYLEGAWNTGMGGGRRPPPQPKQKGGQSPQAAVALPPPLEHPRGELVAWDPSTQKARWRVPFKESWRSGVLATGGDLVFHAVGREFVAFDATTGKRLWAYDTQAPAIAPAATYAIDGEQYVALMVGYGGAGGMGGDQPRRRGRLLVFKLGGTAKAPLYPAAVQQASLDLASAETPGGDIARGAARYGQLCGQCHGQGGYLPNLARSPAILSRDGFSAIVLGGALKERGMASFARFLKPEEVEDVRAFLLQQAKADAAAAAPKPPQELDHAR